MNISLLLKGSIIGLSIAAPVGPIGVLCINRTLAGGRVSGLVSGLGAATADAIYGCIAGFSLTFIAVVFVNQQKWLGLIGGAFLCFLGLKTLLAEPAEQAASVKSCNLIRIFASTFFLTLTNPMTILSFAAIFAGLGLPITNGNYVSAGLLVTGIFLGSSIWWLFLSVVTSAFQAKIPASGLRWINRISGAIIIGFGIFALASSKFA